jgi:MAP/microtubule affinity-regulating kinase
MYEKKKVTTASRKTNIRREIELLTSLNHKLISKILKIIWATNHIILVFNYMAKTNLREFLKDKCGKQQMLEEHEILKIITQTTDALSYLHSENIAHRDIKLENIVIDFKTLNILLIDFGFSLRVKKFEKIENFCGTSSYMPPEIIKK